MSKAKPAPFPRARWSAATRSSSGWPPAASAVYLAEDSGATWWRSRSTCRRRWPSAPGELTPRVKPRSSRHRLGLKSFFEEGRPRADHHPSVVSGAELLPRERDRLHGDELPAGRHAAGLHRHRARPSSATRSFRESTIRSLFDEILRGLRIVHQHKMLHLDIKPANIFIGNDNKAVMLDFGAARGAVQEGNFIRPMYTPGFAAPEMYRRDGTLGPWTDIYAIGACIYAACRAIRRTTRRSGSRRTASRSLAAAQRLLGQPDRGHRVVHVARPAVAPAERVRAAEGTRPRNRAQYTKLSFSERPAQLELTGQRQGVTRPPSRAAHAIPAGRPGPTLEAARRWPAGRTDAIQRLSGQPQGRPREERGPDGLLLHPRRRAVRAGRRDGRASGGRGRLAARAADARGALPARCLPSLADPTRFLNEAIIAGHHQLLHHATQKALLDTPRTTIVACLLQGNAAYWAHCGDSRLYLVRAGKLVARTRDHLHRVVGDAVPGRADRRALQPQRPFTCLRQPGQAGGRCRRPVAAAARRPHPLCSDGLWEQRRRCRRH